MSYFDDKYAVKARIPETRPEDVDAERKRALDSVLSDTLTRSEQLGLALRDVSVVKEEDAPCEPIGANPEDYIPGSNAPVHSGPIYTRPIMPEDVEYARRKLELQEQEAKYLERQSEYLEEQQEFLDAQRLDYAREKMHKERRFEAIDQRQNRRGLWSDDPEEVDEWLDIML